MQLNIEEAEAGTILGCLSEFHCLTDINFVGCFESMFEMEAHLLQCPQLQQLTVNGYWCNEFAIQTDLDIWRIQDVVKANALKKLTIIDSCATEILEYLLSKYTNVKTIKLCLDIPSGNFFHDNDVERVMNALKQASLQQIRLKISLAGSEFHDVLQYLLTNRVNFAITALINGFVYIRINQL
ncbi:unnamed protein product [Mucor fragilis]